MLVFRIEYVCLRIYGDIIYLTRLSIDRIGDSIGMNPIIIFCKLKWYKSKSIFALQIRLANTYDQIIRYSTSYEE